MACRSGRRNTVLYGRPCRHFMCLRTNNIFAFPRNLLNTPIGWHHLFARVLVPPFWTAGTGSRLFRTNDTLLLTRHHFDTPLGRHHLFARVLVPPFRTAGTGSRLFRTDDRDSVILYLLTFPSFRNAAGILESLPTLGAFRRHFGLFSAADITLAVQLDLFTFPSLRGIPLRRLQSPPLGTGLRRLFAEENDRTPNRSHDRSTIPVVSIDIGIHSMFGQSKLHTVALSRRCSRGNEDRNLYPFVSEKGGKGHRRKPVIHTVAESHTRPCGIA
jgi:hypothetical protein